MRGENEIRADIDAQKREIENSGGVVKRAKDAIKEAKSSADDARKRVKDGNAKIKAARKEAAKLSKELRTAKAEAKRASKTAKPAKAKSTKAKPAKAKPTIGNEPINLYQYTVKGPDGKTSTSTLRYFGGKAKAAAHIKASLSKGQALTKIRKVN